MSANTDETQCPQTGTFCWNELLAVETGGAGKFYGELFGWKTEAFSGGTPYTLFKLDGNLVAGLMARPDQQTPPQWLAYVKVDNVDASVQKAKHLGAKVCLEPMDVATVGRIAVFLDPQGAALGLFQPAQGQ